MDCASEELTQRRAVLPHDDPHGGDDLLGHRGRRGAGVHRTVGVTTQEADQLLTGGREGGVIS